MNFKERLKRVWLKIRLFQIRSKLRIIIKYYDLLAWIRYRRRKKYLFESFEDLFYCMLQQKMDIKGVGINGKRRNN